jgi:hypothetical protein
MLIVDLALLTEAREALLDRPSSCPNPIIERAAEEVESPDTVFLCFLILWAADGEWLIAPLLPQAVGG